VKLLFLILLSTASVAFSRLINVSPDDALPIWIVPLPEPTDELIERIESIPEFKLPYEYRITKNSPPDSLDNSLLKFFRPIFRQSGGSCSQASGVGYNFTYEVNYARNTSALDSSNQFPTHHTYNFLNDGNKDNGSWYFDGWDIIKANGIPDLKLYGGLYHDSLNIRHQIWLDGYKKYESGMNNRVTEQLKINAGTPEGLETLKHYLNDYADGSPTGGIVNFVAGVSGSWLISRLRDGTPHAGEYAIRRWNTVPNHAMTIVGYNDSIRWDYNNDGKCTNYDSNGILLPMNQWEVGALWMADSNGTDWPNAGEGGKAWVMYRTLAQDMSVGGIWRNEVHTMRVRESFEPSLKAKVVMNHENRSRLKIYAGVSADTTATEPEHTLSFPLFLYQGGDYGMRADSDTLEFGLDITPLLSYTVPDMPAKYFLCIDENDPAVSYSGSISYFSVIDADSVEMVSSQSNTTVLNNSTTYVYVVKSVSFDPPEITASSLPYAVRNEYYEKQLSAAYGTAPYSWSINFDYAEIANGNSFPSGADSLLAVTNDDDGCGTIKLDFSFPFYGKLYDTLTVSTDGSILFEEGFQSIRSESSIIGNRTISPYAADLTAYPAGGDGVFFGQDQNSVVIRWITSKWDQPEINLDFAVKLYADGTIEFYYGMNLSTGLVWAAGISDGEVNSAIISSISNSFDPSGLKTKFSTNDFPYGMTVSSDGVFSGTLDTDPDIWTIAFRVTDDSNISSVKEIPFTLVSGLESPANVLITAGTNSNILTWNAAQGVNLYNVYRSTDPYGTFNKIATSNTTGYEDTDISGSSKYFYYVTADNSKK
jgi:hypothetical protein